MAESLQQEVEQFGIKVHVIVLGQFRTNILNSGKKQIERSTPSIKDYDGLLAACRSRLEQTNGAQPGDPSQAVQRIVDVVHHAGYFSNKKIPLRVILGSDALSVVRTQCQNMLEELADQESLARSTDFEHKKPVIPYM